MPTVTTSKDAAPETSSFPTGFEFNLVGGGPLATPYRTLRCGERGKWFDVGRNIWANVEAKFGKYEVSTFV
jgi:hypothetical protein